MRKPTVKKYKQKKSALIPGRVNMNVNALKKEKK
jgi:hypothetical protein